MKKDWICENISETADGQLLFAGVKASDLAKKYGTPVYLMDEDRIIHQCRAYNEAMVKVFGDRFQVLYASKACSFKHIYEVVEKEGLGIDVVSAGEIATAKKAGFPLEKAFFHSNNKTDEDIAYAIDNGIGYFVADNEEELFAIERIAGEKNVCQKVLLRLTPGIDPHTYAAISTGQVDSKFGSAIETGQAALITKTALSLPHVDLWGYHCHVGSQVFDAEEVYIQAVDIMLGFMKEMEEQGFTARILDLGGGFGVRYIESQPSLNVDQIISVLGRHIVKKVEELGLSMPFICLEPGRSIVADAGCTLYTVGTIKKIPGYKNYVSVDGGMTDNIRFALYKAPYTIVAAEKMTEERDMVASVVGRCCESGDIIQENVALPSSMKRNDLIACFTTGAYHFSMASNYNRIPRLPVVMLKGGEDFLAVRRETLEDIVSRDL